MENSLRIAPDLLTPSQAAQKIGVSPQTLANWRCTKRYDVPFVQVGRLVRYRAEDIARIATDGLHKSADAA